jgi:hypothetical protein
VPNGNRRKTDNSQCLNQIGVCGTTVAGWSAYPKWVAGLAVIGRVRQQWVRSPGIKIMASYLAKSHNSSAKMQANAGELPIPSCASVPS